MAHKYAIGIDVGGTTTKFGIVSREWRNPGAGSYPQ